MKALAITWVIQGWNVEANTEVNPLELSANSLENVR